MSAHVLLNLSNKLAFFAKSMINLIIQEHEC